MCSDRVVSACLNTKPRTPSLFVVATIMLLVLAACEDDPERAGPAGPVDSAVSAGSGTGEGTSSAGGTGGVATGGAGGAASGGMSAGGGQACPDDLPATAMPGDCTTAGEILFCCAVQECPDVNESDSVVFLANWQAVCPSMMATISVIDGTDCVQTVNLVASLDPLFSQSCGL